MTNQKVSFVTRLRPKTVYEVKSNQDVLASKGILADEYIELSSDYAKKRGAPKRLRRKNKKPLTISTSKWLFYMVGPDRLELSTNGL